MRMYISLALLAAAPAPAQEAAPSQTGSEVVVEGIRLPDDEAPRLGGGDLTGGDPRQSTVANRIRLENSTRFAQCASRGRLSSVGLLRAAVDGMPNDATQRFAQGSLLQHNVTCAADTTLLSARATDLGTSLYDRGALVIEAMRHYTPDLALTLSETGDPAVQARYDRREVPRNRHRLPTDYAYFQIATCLVRFQPTLSVRLALDERTPASRLRIINAIFAGARPCVGATRRVLFDPTQFRLYIADAVYRWAVAARGVDSLLPA